MENDNTVKLSDSFGEGKNGDVLTYSNTDGIVWQTLENTIPETINHEGEVLGVSHKGEVEWVKREIIAGIGLIKDGSGEVTLALNTLDAHNGEVLTFHTHENQEGEQVQLIQWKEGIPDTGTNEHRGHVLTVSDTDKVIWAAPQGGGGSSLPEYTTDDVNKALCVIPEKIFQNYQHVVTGAHIGWKEGIPDYPDLGSAGEYGLEMPIMLSQDSEGTHVRGGFAGCPYTTFGEDNYDMYGTWRFETNEWYPDIENNKYVTTIENGYFRCLGYKSDDDESITEILFKVTRKPRLIPFCCIEFENRSGRNLTVNVVCVESSPTIESDEENLVQISENGTTASNVIADNTYAQIQVLGHGYTIKTYPGNVSLQPVD